MGYNFTKPATTFADRLIKISKSADEDFYKLAGRSSLRAFGLCVLMGSAATVAAAFAVSTATVSLVSVIAMAASLAAQSPISIAASGAAGLVCAYVCNVSLRATAWCLGALKGAAKSGFYTPPAQAAGTAGPQSPLLLLPAPERSDAPNQFDKGLAADFDSKAAGPVADGQDNKAAAPKTPDQAPSTNDSAPNPLPWYRRNR